MWMHFGIKDLIDVLLVAFFLYQTYKIMKSSGTLAIFSGVVSFIVVWILVSQVLEMRLMGAILDKIISVGFVVLVILSQDEIRRFLLALGSHRGWKFLGNLFSKRNSDEKEGKYIAPVVVACKNMARKKTGALIVVQQDVDLSIYEHTGEMFCADPNARLIENIFFKNSPLHDGAMIVRNKRIAAAGCILPVSHNVDIPRSFGLRHRSALGIAEKSDALAIVVSEETGAISVANEGVLYSDVSTDKLEVMLSQV